IDLTIDGFTLKGGKAMRRLGTVVDHPWEGGGGLTAAALSSGSSITLTVRQTTITKNGVDGTWVVGTGGVLLLAELGSVTGHFDGVVISKNKAPAGAAGVMVFSQFPGPPAGTATLTMTNSIVTENKAAGGPAIVGYGINFPDASGAVLDLES